MKKQLNTESTRKNKNGGRKNEIHEGSFVLTNVLSLKQTVDNEEWSDIAILLRNHVGTEGMCRKKGT